MRHNSQPIVTVTPASFFRVLACAVQAAADREVYISRTAIGG